MSITINVNCDICARWENALSDTRIGAWDEMKEVGWGFVYKRDNNDTMRRFHGCPDCYEHYEAIQKGER